jgi:uncharacterized OB-fold protein
MQCGTVYFPSRVICPKCRRKGKLERVKLSGEGKVYSYTVIHAPALGFEKVVPYVFAIIELKEGPRLSAQIIDVEPSEVYIGMPVKAVFRKIQSDDPEGLVHYGFKFIPVEKVEKEG